MFESSDSENAEVEISTKKGKTKKIKDDSSSSESDIENYLQKPEDLKLNSTFFKVDKNPIKRKLEQPKAALSDSDSDDPLAIYVNKCDEIDKNEPVASTSKVVSSKQTTENVQKSQLSILDAFRDQSKHELELAEAKKQVEAYLSKRLQEKSSNSDEITNLLTQGEKPFDLAKDLAEVGFHPSDFESDHESGSEKEDWEEVKESTEKQIVPKDGVEITLSLPTNIAKKKKGIDLMAALKRRMNRIRKENQVYVHKVHLLCWIAHGNYVNNVLNKENVMGMALSLLPTKECYPPSRTNLKYLEQITKWYRKSMKYIPSPDQDIKSSKTLEEIIQEEIGARLVESANVLVYIFVAMLRALGMQCRVVFSLQVEPLRPPNSELCSLKGESKSPKAEVKKSEAGKEKIQDKNSINNKKVVKSKGKHEMIEEKQEKTEEEEKIKDKRKKTNEKREKTNKNEEKTNEKQEKSKQKQVKPKEKPKEKQETPKESQETPKQTQEKPKKTQEKPKTPQKPSEKPQKTSKIPENKSPEKPTTSKTKENSPTKPNLSKLTKPNEPKSPEKPSKRITRSSTSKIPRIEAENADTDFKSLVPTLTKTKTSNKRSKSLSNQQENTTNLTVPNQKSKTKRSNSETTKKPKLISSIDATVAQLEALEAPKPDLNKFKRPKPKQIESSTEDEDFCERSMWRRSKSKSPALKTSIKPTTLNQSAEKAKTSVFNGNPALVDSIFQSSDENSDKNQGRTRKNNKIKIRAPVKRNLPQVDGNFDGIDSFTSSDEDENSDFVKINQLDGTDDEKLKKSSKAVLFKRLPQTTTTSTKTSPDLSKLKLANHQKSSEKTQKSSTSSYKSSPERPNVKNVIVNLVKHSIREEKTKLRQKTVKKTNYKEDKSDTDSDFEPSPKLHKPLNNGKVKRRVLPRSQLEALAKQKAEEKKKVKGIDVWVEVFLEEEEKWISADVVNGKVHCIKEIHTKASHPVSYILSWDNLNKIKDVTKRYCPNWNTVTRKLRVEPEWWEASLKPYLGQKTARDKEEDEDLARQQLDQPLPKTISEYKDHPLYVLKRHLLKFQALYPPDPAVLGFIRNEAVYSRDCVYTLHSRDIWLKHAKVVKPGEQSYKIVKARPKWDKLSNAMITDQLLEIFGVWQVQDYDPPTAENGVVPRNAYGNVELFKPCMLPKKCVHLQLPGLKKVAAKLKIDCAPAVTGFDFHGGWNHAVYDGYIVCEEFKDVLIAAWEQEQEEITKREQEKYEKRVFGNWRRLIKAALIRRRLKLRYDFSEKPADILDESNDSEMLASPEVEPKKDEVASVPSKPKRPKFMSRK